MKFPARLVTVLLCLSLKSALASAATSPKELLAAGRVDEVIESLQTRISRQPDDADSHNLLCRAYFMLEEWDRGIAECERTTKLAPDVARYHLWLGRIYGEKADRASFLSAAGLAKKVRTEFERAVELDPHEWEARVVLAEFYLEAPGIVGGGKDKARAQAEALDKLRPAMAHYVRGRISEKEKDNAAAEREYRAAIDASGGGAHAWLNLALFFRHENRFAEMEQALRTMDTRPLDDPESLMDGGSVILRSGHDYALGIHLVEHYLDNDPVEAGPVFKAHYILGQLFEKQEDKKSAAERYRAALALAHDFTRAREALKRLEH